MQKLVLLIDDSNEMHKVVGLGINSQRYALISAYSVEEGLALLAVQKPDAMLLGGKFCKKENIEKLQKACSCPVIAIFNRQTESTLNVSILQYPFSAATLNSTINQSISNGMETDDNDSFSMLEKEVEGQIIERHIRDKMADFAYTHADDSYLSVPEDIKPKLNIDSMLKESKTNGVDLRGSIVGGIESILGKEADGQESSSENYINQTEGANMDDTANNPENLIEKAMRLYSDESKDSFVEENVKESAALQPEAQDLEQSLHNEDSDSLDSTEQQMLFEDITKMFDEAGSLSEEMSQENKLLKDGIYEMEQTNMELKQELDERYELNEIFDELNTQIENITAGLNAEPAVIGGAYADIAEEPADLLAKDEAASPVYEPKVSVHQPDSSADADLHVFVTDVKHEVYNKEDVENRYAAKTVQSEELEQMPKEHKKPEYFHEQPRDYVSTTSRNGSSASKFRKISELMKSIKEDEAVIRPRAGQLTIELSREELSTILEKSMNREVLEDLVKDAVQVSLDNIVPSLTEKLVREELGLLRGRK